MKLVELRIKNFRGLGGGQNVINFKDSNIIFLIGQNNVGKSSFLKAYKFFVDSKQKATVDDFFNHDVSNAIEIEGDFIVEENDGEIVEFSAEPDWIASWVQVETNLITVKKVWDQVDGSFKKFTKKPDGSWQRNGFGGLDTLFQRYAPTPISINALGSEEELEVQVNKLIEAEFLKKIEEDFSTQYEIALTAIKNLQSNISSADRITQYNEKINLNFKKIFPKLTLEITSKNDEQIDVVNSFKKNHSIAIKKDGIDRKEIFSSHGHGVIRQAFFNFLAFMKNESDSNQKKFLLLFEEPEIFLHPKSEKLLRDQLYYLSENSPFQILCATHSPQMIDISKPHSSLVRITKDDQTEVTKTHQVGHSIFQNEINKQFVQMINKFDPNICEVFYSNNVIIVEGDTEAIILRELLKKYHNDKDIFILNSGSKNNIPFFARILNHFSIKYFVIHDSDTRFIYNDKERTIVKKNNDQSNARNSAWAFNQQIFTEIINGRNLGLNIKRHVSVYDFEIENGYVYTEADGKPLSAYKFILDQIDNRELKITRVLEQIVNDTYDIEWDMAYLESNVIEQV